MVHTSEVQNLEVQFHLDLSLRDMTNQRHGDVIRDLQKRIHLADHLHARLLWIIGLMPAEESRGIARKILKIHGGPFRRSISTLGLFAWTSQPHWFMHLEAPSSCGSTYIEPEKKNRHVQNYISMPIHNTVSFV